MDKDKNCGYCMEGDLLANFGIKICDLDTSALILFKEQSHKGRIIVAHKKHISEFVELTDEERNTFFSDINKAAKAVHSTFKPDKINYGAFGDTGCHLHFHLVPKYKDGFEWGDPFVMKPDKVYLSDDEYVDVIDKI